MIRWNKPVIARDQLPLFAPTLDAFLAEDHSVRVVAEVLQELDFGDWEREYDGLQGQPPIHPRVLAGAILYGMSIGLRSSRRLEDACGNRLDFIWLVEGRTIDHSTFCKFRTQHHQRIKQLFRQIVLAGQQMGLTRLNQVIWDGTRIQANNSRHGTARQPALEEMIRQLDQQYEQMAAEAVAADQREEQLFAAEGSSRPLPAKLADAQRRLQRLKQALKNLQSMQAGPSAAAPVPPVEPPAAPAEPSAAPAEASPETEGPEPEAGVPPTPQAQAQAKTEAKKGAQIPLTDPDARVLPNKSGGFAANYTPVLAVDGDSGLVLDGQVVPGRCEEQAIVPALDRIEQLLGQLPQQALADSGFHTIQTLEDLEKRQVEALIPQRVIFKNNPAERPDPTAAVPEAQWTQLPVNPTSKVLDRAAFVFDAEQDCYWCPMGRKLSFAKEHAYWQEGHRREYRIYRAPDCEGCEHRKQCIKGRARQRQIYRGRSEPVRERAAQRLKSEAGQQAYRRRFRVESPFGLIKSAMGVRQFLLRGMAKVSLEWDWVLMAYNLRLLVAARRRQAAASL